MPHDIGGAADHAVLAYARAACDAGAAGDRRMRADAYVVSNLDQIVQLDSVVADHHRSGLRNLSPDALLQRNAESIGADHRARMDQRALAQATTRVDSDMRMQPAGGADLDCIAEVATRADHHPPAELHAAAHIRPGADAGAGRHPRPALDNCGPVHPWFGYHRRIEQGGDLGEIQIGIVADDARQLRKAAVRLAEDHRAGARSGQLFSVFAVAEKTDMLRRGTLQRPNLADRRLRVADYLPTEAFDDLGQAIFLGLSHRRRLFPRRLVVQRLDHLVRDVDARAGVDGLLENDVVFLRLGNRLDGAIGALEHRSEFLVAPLVEILAEFALLALKILAHFAEFALLVAAIGFGHGDRVFLQVILHLADLRGHLLDVLVALGEFLFDLLLRAHCGSGVAEYPLGVDEADFQLGGGSTAADQHAQYE